MKTDATEHVQQLLQSAFDEGYRAGYEQGADDATAFEWGSGSKSQATRDRNRQEAWQNSETLLTLQQ